MMSPKSMMPATRLPAASAMTLCGFASLWIT
jgi:hypothetical protein